MRNLKRALSLTLASVMLLGMMVIGTSAASYPDVDQEDNVEAIEVLQAVKVMQGDDKGNFDPDREVSRNEMAIVMAKLLNLDYDYYQNTCPFWDVPDYAKPYVAACYANGIVSGYNATTYGGADTVTAVQAASMMMRALGYFQHQADYEGDFVLSTVKQASKISLFDGINASQDTPLTRNQVAQLALNALEARMVDFDGDLGIDLPNYGVVGYNSKYEFRTGTQSKYRVIEEDGETSSVSGGTSQYYVQLGEQLYDGDLKKTNTTNGFGAPSARWTYKNSEIGVYADEADFVFEGVVKSNTMYSAVGKTAAEDYQWIVKMDGASSDLGDIFGDPDLKLFTKQNVIDNDSKDLDGTKRGATTYVYLDETNQDGYRGTAIVCIVNTYAAEITRVSGETITLDDMDKPGLEYDINGYAEEDVVLYTKSVNANKEWTVESVLGEAELVEDKVDGIRDTDRVIIGDKTYRYNYRFNDDKGPMLDTDSVNENVAFYLDTQGHIIRMADANVSNDYALVYSVGDAGNKYGSDAEYGAKLILTDGSTMNVDIDSDTTDQWIKGISDEDDKLDAVKAALLDQIVSYTSDSAGLYTLTVRTTDRATWTGSVDDVIKGGQSRIVLPNGSYLYADENSAILVNTDATDLDDYSAYKGYQNAPTVDTDNGSELVAYVKNGVVKAVYINRTESSGSSKNVIFVKGDPGAKRNRLGSDYYYVYSAVIDGEVQDIRIKDGTAAKTTIDGIGKNDIGIYFGYTEDSNKLVTKLTTDLPKDVDINGVKTENASGNYYGTNRANLWHGARWNAPGAVGLMAFDWNQAKGEYTQTPGRNADALIVYANTNHDLRVEKTLLSDRNDEVLVVRDDGVVIAVFVQEISGGVDDTPDVPDTSFSIKYTVDGGTEQSASQEKGKVWTYNAPEGKLIASATNATVAADKKSLTVSETQAAAGIVAITLEDAEKPAIDSNLRFVTVSEGYKITEAHVITAAEHAGPSTGNKYYNKGAGKLYLEYTVPAGAAIDTSAAPTVSMKAGVMTYAVTMGNNTAVSGLTYSSTSSNALPTFTGTADLTFTAAAVTGYAVKYDLSAVSGYGLTGGSSNTDESKTAASGALNFTLDGFPAYMKEAKVVYTVTGLTGDQEATLNLGSSKKVTTTAFTTDKDVDVVVKSITATKVNATVSGATGATSSLASGGVTVSNTAGAIGTVTLASWPTGVTAKVSYKITGMTTDDATNAPLTGTVNGVNSTTVTLPSGNHYTPEGNKAVNIEITGIEYTEVTGANAIRIIADGALDSQAYTSFAVTSGSGKIALTKSGNTYTNTGDISVTLTYAAAFTTAGKTATVTFANPSVYSGTAITTSATVADTSTKTVTFTIAAGTLTIDPAGQVAILVTPNT